MKNKGIHLLWPYNDLRYEFIESLDFKSMHKYLVFGIFILLLSMPMHIIHSASDKQRLGPLPLVVVSNKEKFMRCDIDVLQMQNTFHAADTRARTLALQCTALSAGLSMVFCDVCDRGGY